MLGGFSVLIHSYIIATFSNHCHDRSSQLYLTNGLHGTLNYFVNIARDQHITVVKRWRCTCKYLISLARLLINDCKRLYTSSETWY